MSGSETLDVGSLLTIDVESELRKLTRAQLQGSWQLPAELVRRAIRHGAERVEIELARQHLRVRWVGGGLDAELLHELAVLLDTRREAERRHRALTKLEHDGALPLLALFGLDASIVRLTAAPAFASVAERFEWRGPANFELVRAEPSPYTEVFVRGGKFDRNRARNHLGEVLRFASVTRPVAIEVDGRPLVQGFEDALAEIRVVEPWPALVAIPRHGELGRIIVLQHGVVSTHISLPDAPAFEVALEVGSAVEASASPARMREVVGASLDRILEVAIECMIELGRSGAILSPADRGRLGQQLLRAARRDRARAKAIARLPLFRGVEPDGRERWYDLLALRQSVQEELLMAIFPDQDLAAFTPEGRVYVLDESERALIGEILEVGFRQPRGRIGHRPALGDVVRHGLLASLADRLASLRPGGEIIPDSELEADERHLLVLLRAQLEACDVSMCSGAGAVRRRGGGRGSAGPTRLSLPRHGAQVRAAVRAVARDPGWVYPALLALLEGRDFPLRARRRWRVESWRA